MIHTLNGQTASTPVTTTHSNEGQPSCTLEQRTGRALCPQIDLILLKSALCRKVLPTDAHKEQTTSTAISTGKKFGA